MEADSSTSIADQVSLSSHLPDHQDLNTTMVLNEDLFAKLCFPIQPRSANLKRISYDEAKKLKLLLIGKLFYNKVVHLEQISVELHWQARGARCDSESSQRVLQDYLYQMQS